MAASKQKDDTQDNGADMAMDPHDPTDFFESEISRYSANLEADPEETYQRYGFTLFHSLPPAQMVLENQKLGFFRGDAVDTYNLAGLELAKDNIEGGLELLEKSYKMDDSIADAAHNIALCYEKLGRKADSIKMWKRYVELAEEDEDRAPVEAHLAELQA